MIDRKILESLEKVSEGEIFSTHKDPEGVEYGWMYEPVETHDTLEDFERASDGYAESSNPEKGTLAGFPTLFFDRVQVRRGDQRTALTVIDVGEVRLAFRADFSEFFE
jgi:hypothetical protein